MVERANSIGVVVDAADADADADGDGGGEPALAGNRMERFMIFGCAPLNEAGRSMRRVCTLCIRHDAIADHFYYFARWRAVYSCNCY